MTAANPIGSTGKLDFNQNVANFDIAMNDLIAQTWLDRFGIERLTYSEMERRVKSVVNEIVGESGSSLVGHGEITVARALDLEILIPFFAPVTDYGPIITEVMTRREYGGKALLEPEKYPVRTTIQRRAGWFLEGNGRTATELVWMNNTPNAEMVTFSKDVLKDRSDRVIGNGSGQYFTGIKNLSLLGKGTGIGLKRGEAWWDRIDNVIIDGFDIGQQDGIGTSNVTGCYWCRTESVWYRNNRVNLRITDFTNLNTWASCRFSNAGEWDIEFVEPTNPLSLGMQGNRFEDCELASGDSIRLAARIFDMTFHNTYFEQPGYAVYDDSTHTKGSVLFTGVTKVFGGKSIKNKFVLGRQGSCSNWRFDYIKTNLGKADGITGVNYVIDGGALMSNLVVNEFVHTGSGEWELTQAANYVKNKLDYRGTGGKAVTNSKKHTTEENVVKISRVKIDPDATINLGGERVTFGKNISALADTQIPILEIEKFAQANAYAYANVNIKISGVDSGAAVIKNASLNLEISANTTTLGAPIVIEDRQTTTRINVKCYFEVVEGKLVVKLNAVNTGTTYVQVYAMIEVTTLGRFVGQVTPII